MPEFRYSVVDAKGQPSSGIIESENEEECRRTIEQRGLFCLNVSPVSFAFRSINFNGKTKIKIKELSIFCRQFSTMLSSGIGIIKSLDILHNQAENRDFKTIIKRVYESVQRGQSLSASLSAQDGAFPELMICMVEAGEASGSLDTVMERIADHFENSSKIKNKVRNAMMYPLILSILTICVLVMLMVFVVPTFIGMYKTAEAALPIPTQILVAISSSLTGYWYIYLAVIGIIYILFSTYLKNEKGRLSFDKFKTTIPIAGKLNVIILSSRFARTLSTMMQSGIPLLKSLEITSKVLGNKYFESGVNDISENIKRGISLSAAIKKAEIFPIMLLSMISIGEESGTLDDALNKTANFYDEQSNNAITKLVGLLEPIMIIIMAVLVGFIVISIVMPMYGMMQLVG